MARRVRNVRPYGDHDVLLAELRKEISIKNRLWRERNRERGCCELGPSHGKATHGDRGTLCERCYIRKRGKGLWSKSTSIPRRVRWELERLAQRALAVRGLVPLHRIKVLKAAYEGNPLLFLCRVDGEETVFEMPQGIADMVQAIATADSS